MASLEKKNTVDPFLGQPSREKYWVELTADEKSERCREEIKSAKTRIRELEMITENLRRMVQMHRHAGPLGELVVPIEHAQWMFDSSRHGEKAFGSIERDPNKVSF